MAVIGICIAIIAACVLTGGFLLWKMIRDLTEKYVTLEEWGEDRLKEQRCMIAELYDKLDEIEQAFPKNSKGEFLRNEILMRKYNDELERNLQMEKAFNDDLSAILNFGKPK